MKKNLVYPDYKKCLTNLACSILKYFEARPKHNTLRTIDSKLSNKEYKNVLLLIYDGMGSQIVKKHLAEDSFLRKNITDEITSVFPSSTVAATTSLLSGLNPCEHGWMGWDVYFQDMQKTITVFTNKLKDTNIDADTENVAEKYIPYKSIIEQINEDGKHKAYRLSPFGEGAYEGLDDLTKRIVELSQQDGKKYIYAYYDEPDGTLHDMGTKHSTIKELMDTLNSHAQNLTSKLKDTLIIITADHGHIDTEEISLKEEYPDFVALLERDTAIEGRACAFWVKEEKKDTFIKKFNEYFSQNFILFSKEEIIAKDIFGTGVKHKNFEATLGDYVAVATGNKYFELNYYEDKMLSHHGCITKEEMMVPLILVET